MKRRDLLSIFVNSLLTFVMGFCGAGCIVTAFRLPVSMAVLAWVCALCSLAFCVGMRFRWGFLALALLALPGLEYLTHTNVLQQLQQLLYQVLKLYNTAYGLPIPSVAVDAGLKDLTLAVCLVALLGSLLTAVSLSRRRSFGAVVAPVLLLMPCLVVVDTPPESVYVFWLLAAVALVLLTAGTRRRDELSGSRLVVLALVPVMLANWLVMTARPRQDYQTPQLPGLYEKLEQWWESFREDSSGGHMGPGFTLGTTPHSTQSRVDLTTVGPKGQSEYVTMRVHGTVDELLYLRGRSYSTYDGKGWIADASGDLLSIQDRTYLNKAGSNPRNLKITTIGLPKFLYTGYYLLQKTSLDNGLIPNDRQQLSYVIQVHDLSKNWKMRYLTAHEDLTLQALQEHIHDQAQYLQLPEQTRAGALAYLEREGIHDQLHVLDAAKLIVDYVRQSATYDLNTGRMDPDAEDFALWFLEESDTGYCVHFATAAVVLLRAAGIPARYVEGYALHVDAYLETEVRMRHAHAWVEYYLPDMGWLILEPTPSRFAVEPPKPTQPPTVPTVPTGPTEPTAPTKPTRPTGPTTTVPTEPTEPTAPTKPTRPTGSVPPAGTGNPTDPDVPAPKPAPRDWSWLWKLLRYLAMTALAVLVFLWQRPLRLRLRCRRLSRGTPNEQARQAWHHTRYLARLRRQQPPEALEELALKARFSQHTVTEEELAQFRAYFHRSRAHLQSRPWPLRFVYRWILALW